MELFHAYSSNVSNRQLKKSRSPFDGLRANGGNIEIIKKFHSAWLVEPQYKTFLVTC